MTRYDLVAYDIHEHVRPDGEWMRAKDVGELEDKAAALEVRLEETRVEMVRRGVLLRDVSAKVAELTADGERLGKWIDDAVFNAVLDSDTILGADIDNYAVARETIANVRAAIDAAREGETANGGEDE